ncbi:MAG TPA: O-methyltransferase [Gemmatimonadaceae bacterium]
MDQNTWTEVDDYLAGLLAPSDPVLDSAQATTAAAGMPAISVSPMQGKMLQVLATGLRARSILEIGTLGGYSTIWLARGMASGGRLITLEKERKHAEVARANIARAGFANVVELRIGSALESLPKLETEGRGPFDLIFIDADKPNIPSYFEWALKLSHSGTVIIVDNVIREGDVSDAESDDPSTRGVRRFFDMLSVTSRVTATAIQTVGLKGYDGFSMAVVN